MAAVFMREYETIYILRPDLGEQEVNQIATRIKSVIRGQKGKLVKQEFWGKRRLAYEIRRHLKGCYILLQYAGYPGTVEEVERNFKMLEPVIKFQTVKLRDKVAEADVVEGTDQPIVLLEQPEPEEKPAGGESPVTAAGGEAPAEAKAEEPEDAEQPGADNEEQDKDKEEGGEG